jgi:ADP-ribose pyrophosphatase YjhB (NUDIX family)
VTPFSTVKIRTAAAVICNQEVALIHRTKGATDQYTLPGGNVEPGEQLTDAIRRELAEELGLHLNPDADPQLLAVQDQMVTRPGATPPPRKIHFVFAITVTAQQRAGLATVEHDDLSDGQIVWQPLAGLAGLHLYPAVGDVLSGLAAGHPSGAVLLPALTDRTFAWV